MNITELKKIIREEAKRSLTEAAPLVKLPKGFYVKSLGGTKYALYYSEFYWEPSIAQVSSTVAKVYATMKKYAKELGLVSGDSKPKLFVIDGQICIGDTFKSTMKPAQMDNSVGIVDDEY